jgi:hypothetical protein
MQAGTIAVGLLMFDGVEVLDACGPFDVFGTAAGWPQRTPASPPRGS